MFGWIRDFPAVVLFQEFSDGEVAITSMFGLDICDGIT